MRIQYEDWTPGPDTVSIVARADAICAEYSAQGYDLTLRQLYYQFVARGFIPNTQQSYKRLGDIVNRARMAGLLDWDYIVDRTRNLRGTSHWDDPAKIIRGAADSYRIDKWVDQPTRVEVWVEKDALASVIQRAADRHDLDWFACRGYVSQSEMWGAAQRLGDYLRAGQRVVILHLGDHDPSGIDMTRDITDRLTQFVAVDLGADPGSEDYAYELDNLADDLGLDIPALEVRRIALTYDQVQQYSPPPNPTKLTDSRASGYLKRYGRQSWELDALEPSVLEQLIAREIQKVVDPDRFDVLAERERSERSTLDRLSDEYPRVCEFLDREAS